MNRLVLDRPLLVVLSILFVGGCAASLTPAGQNAKLMKADPPPNCEELGSVSGSADGLDGEDESAKIRMRNEAGEKNANYVRIESMKAYPNSTVEYVGTAFRCP